MVKKITLDKIYNVVPANLEYFTSPVFKRRFRFLTDEEMIDRSREIASLIAKRKPDTILYSDTGACPMAYICQSLGKTKQFKNEMGEARWLPIKCPREAFGSYEKIILFLLTPGERSACLSRDIIDELKRFCELKKISPAAFDVKTSREDLILAYKFQLNKLFFGKINVPLREVLALLKNVSETHEFFGLLLKGTKFHKTLLGNVVYLDEYLDSGVTLSNTANVLRCFNPKINLSVAAYHVFASRKDLDEDVVESIHTKDEGSRAFVPGAYPYENRLDIIGRYYFEDGENFRKAEISATRRRIRGFGFKKREIEKFLEKCLSFIEKKRLLSSLNAKFKIKKIADSGTFDRRQAVRYLLYLFEDGLSGSRANSKLLWNLFDMHGPAWSPLPDIYHFDFWNASSLLKNEVVQMPEFLELRRDYKKNRRQIISEIVRICDKIHKGWQINIDKIIGNKLKK